MKTTIIAIAILALGLYSCNEKPNTHLTTRGLVDTIGFAQYGWQVDSVMARINRIQSTKLGDLKIDESKPWRVAICPHDDYTYVGWQYPATLRNIKAKTVIIFGVAHKARQLNVSDQVVFDSFDFWHGPYKDIKVASAIREELIENLPGVLYQVNDSLQKVEHSVESMLPFLQYFNRDVEIVSILVPFMNFDRMEDIARHLATSINQIMKENQLRWGDDITLLITTDAVHYGDEDWGGKDYAPFGVDSLGYCKAVKKENSIIDSCLTGDLSIERIKRFIGFTVQPNNYKEYQWTWCGRYSVPLGLLTAFYLQRFTKDVPLQGQLIGYSNSIDHQPIKVDDIGMGKTAIATQRHWVGYASVGFK